MALPVLHFALPYQCDGHLTCNALKKGCEENLTERTKPIIDIDSRKGNVKSAVEVRSASHRLNYALWCFGIDISPVSIYLQYA